MASRVLALRIYESAPRAKPGARCLGQKVPELTPEDRQSQRSFAALVDTLRVLKRSDAQAPLREFIAARRLAAATA